MKNINYNDHHEIAKYRTGTNEKDNIKKILITMHNAINILFGPATPQEELIKVLNLNETCLTDEWKNDLKKVLLVKDPEYIYKKGLYVKKESVIWKPENTRI